MSAVLNAPPPPLLRDALAGLRRRGQKTLPSKHFYDTEGSRLFEQITALDAYYPTRTEAALLRTHGDDIAAFVGPEALLIEYGSGASVKTRLLLDRLPDLRAYVPIDISAEHLLDTVEALRADYPALRVVPVVADYTRRFRLPRLSGRRVLFFPGSTVGNFTPEEAARFLTRMAQTAGPGGRLVIGVDTPKDPAVLERAYDDPEGVTAAFNRNLLVRLNREAGADFDLAAWQHRAVWNAAASRVEMHLVSAAPQTVHLGDAALRFRAGETIHTEIACKYTPEAFAALAEGRGLAPRADVDQPGALVQRAGANGGLTRGPLARVPRFSPPRAARMPERIGVQAGCGRSGAPGQEETGVAQSTGGRGGGGHIRLESAVYTHVGTACSGTQGPPCGTEAPSNSLLRTASDRALSAL